MEFTKEQYDIINSTGNIKINAVAGSGKTTTIIEYANAQPKDKKILYLAFNKSVKLEAERKFKSKGLSNVKVETAHSLAHKFVVRNSNYSVKKSDYKTSEIVEILSLEGNAEKHAQYIIANHINKFISYFCNSDKGKIQDLNYVDIISDIKAKIFVTNFYNYIENQTRFLLDKMNKGDIEITHDFYLKKFQLSKPVLDFDYILFDEGQDASQAMLDIFFNQNATKVIVGDTYQQIYGWRFAVNSLEKANFKTFHLSSSFRFSQDIANLAMEILKWKSHIGEYKPINISGKGVDKEDKTKAVLARTNLGLLLLAIEYIVEKKKVEDKQIYFEGNISSYTYAEDGASLYDVLNLYTDKRHLIKDKLIMLMKDIDELEDYVEKAEDVQLGLMVEIVKKYGDEIPNIIKAIKEKHVNKDEKENADIIFSTIHRCKGMEYDAIHLAKDFITEEKIKKLKEDNPSEIIKAKINEEINLLYVAITRTKNLIYIPETLIPNNYSKSTQIQILKVTTSDEKQDETNPNDKAYSYDEIRTIHKDAYKPWTSELDNVLTVMYCEKVSIKDMAKHFGRTTGAIASRIKKLELQELYG